MQLPNLSTLSLRDEAPVGAPGDGAYDPSRGGDVLQAYFADMVLDSDRNAMYARAILAAVREFVRTEGRAPRVLDAGCGFGVLTLFALSAGAEHVISVDVNQEHVALLHERLPARFAGKYTPVHIDLKRPNPFKAATLDPALRFDMLISEILGTFANSENEFKYLSEYATHMTTHASGKVYCVPHRVIQTFRKIALPARDGSHISQLMENDFELQYMPTEHVGLLYEWMEPQYLEEAVAVRTDLFDRRPFQCVLPHRVQFATGWYVAEWKAVLWTDVTLHNTWEWAYTHTADLHSKHARARAWGLMLFRVPDGMVATANTATANANDNVPNLVLDERELGIAYAVNPSRRTRDRLRLVPFEDYTRTSPLEDDLPDGVDNRYISMRAIAAGMPYPIVLSELYAVTIGALLRAYKTMGLCLKWLPTLKYMGVLPFLAFGSQYRVATDYDVPVTILRPRGVETHRYHYLTKGAQFKLYGCV